MSRACILQNLSFLIRTIPSVLEFLKRSPDQPLSRVMDYTIGREFHPATKTSIFIFEIGMIASTSSVISIIVICIAAVYPN